MMSYLRHILCVLAVFSGIAHSNAQNLSEAKEQSRNFVKMVTSGNDSAIYTGYQLQKKFKEDEALRPLLSRVYLSMGNYYKDRGDLPKAIEFYQLTEDIAIEFNDTVFIAYAKGSMGFVYTRTGRFKLALDRYLSNLELWKSRRDPTWIPTACHNIVKCLKSLDSMDAIPPYIDYGLSVADSFNIVKGKSDLEYDRAEYLLNVGYDHHLEDVIYWLKKSEATARESSDASQLDKVLLLTAEVAQINGNTEEADSLCKTVYDRLKHLTIDRPLYLKSCECLVRTRQSLGKKEMALDMMWLLVKTNDSLSMLSRVNQLSKLELNHGIYRQSMKDSLDYVYAQNEAKMQLAAEKERHQLFTWIGILIGLIVISLAIYLYRNYRTRKQALVELELVNQEIKDSINYAFRIQNAFLPKTNLLNQWFNDAFVLYLPKDVVAGDFYWFEEVGDWVIVASADCTGHGVPGAMVSVVCHSALQKALTSCGPENPETILSKTSQLVEERFMLDNAPMKDGMDIGLCCLNRKSGKLRFSGAHNPLWLVQDGKVLEFKGDRRPVGFYDGEITFTKHEIDLKPGDSFYLTSDGYADQFGGDAGKKFKSKSLKQLILAHSHEPMHEQKEFLEKAFYKWMSGFEQLDDVCLLGIRV